MNHGHSSDVRAPYYCKAGFDRQPDPSQWFCVPQQDLGFREVAPSYATSHLSISIPLFGGSHMSYRFVATSVAGLVQQLAVGYVTNGYYFYVTGYIPNHKDPSNTDRKILDAYGIEISKWTRSRRKKEGEASVQYLRHGGFYVILATHGVHPFFASEAKRLRDIRKHPISYMGYSIGCRRERGGGEFHASVRIQQNTERELKAHFQGIALHKTVEELYVELRRLPFEPYAPVRVQLHCLLRRINRRRALAGLELVPREAIRVRRSPVRPFEKRADCGDVNVYSHAVEKSESSECPNHQALKNPNSLSET